VNAIEDGTMIHLVNVPRMVQHRYRLPVFHSGVVQDHDFRVYSSSLSIYAVLLSGNLVNLAREVVSQSDTR